MKKSDVIAFFARQAGLKPTQHGAKAATARALGLTKQALTHWGELVPESIAYKVQVLSRGKLKVNPKLYEQAKERDPVAA